jgi:MoaA/NifB/PqqE/SkfB family radical SAM enzyme
MGELLSPNHSGRKKMLTDLSNSELVDSDTRDRFRKILAEYDIVATGIKTLDRQLAFFTDPVALLVAEQLRALERRWHLQRSLLWNQQVTNEGLSGLFEDLLQVSEDPMADLSFNLNRIKSVLTPLSMNVEAKIDREHRFVKSDDKQDNIDKKRDNLELLSYEMIMGMTILQSKPLRHMLDTTSRCNFRCLTCYQRASQDIVHYDLADAPYQVLVPAFAFAKQVFVQAMGETFLSRSAFPLVAAAKSSGAYVEAITNGTTLERGAQLLDAVDLLMVSIDGGTEETFSLIRRNGSLDKISTSIATLPRDARRSICFNVVVCRQNVYSMDSVIDLALSLGVGHIHFQEMNGYLPWHKDMLIDEEDRNWFFYRLPIWRYKVKNSGIFIYCNLVPCKETPRRPRAGGAPAAQVSAKAVADVPVPSMPRRATMEQLSNELENLIQDEPPEIFRQIAVSASLLAEDNARSDELSPTETTGPVDWEAARARAAAGEATFPHCLSAYAHFVVNGDGTTRSCCRVQNRLADLSQGPFGKIWNSENYVTLRTAHAQQIAPADPCVDCRDPVRFHFIDEILSELESHGVDISRIRRPKDFPLPATYAENPVVRKLGTQENT